MGPRRPSKPAKTPRVQPKQVGSTFGLPDPGNLFSGMGSGAPARKTKIPNLTEQVALARARQDRLKSGGLLTPSQQKAEQLASAVVHMKMRYTPALPQPASTPPPAAPKRELVAQPPAKPRARLHEHPAANPPKGGDFLGGIADYLSGPAIGHAGAHWLGKNVLAPAVKGGTYAFGTGASVALADLGVGSTDILTKSGLQSKNYVTPQDALQRIARAGVKTPDISIPVGAIRGINFGADVAYAKGGAKTSVPFKDLMEHSGWDVTPAYRAKLIPIIRKNGYSGADIEGKMGPDLILMAYNKKPGLVESLAKGFASDVVMGGSTTLGAAGLLAETAQGHGGEAAKGLLRGITSVTPGLADHPVGDVLEAHPLFAATALHGGLKSVGSLGHLRPGVPGERNVRLSSRENLAGEAPVVNAGRYSKNFVTAAEQSVKDLVATHGGPVGRKLSGKLDAHAIDEVVRHNRNHTGYEHVPVQAAHRAVALKIGPARSSELMAWIDAGGKPGLENGIAHFREQAAKGNPRGEVMAQHYEKALAHPPTTPDELAYVQTFHEAASQTSNERQKLGLHGPIAQTYRQYETPIQFAASRGDAVAERAVAARNAYHDLWDKAKSEGKPTAFKGKITEIGRDIKRHTKKETPTLEEWRAQGKEIAKRKPKLREGASEAQKKAHAADMRQWRNEKARHTRLGGRISAHATESRQQGARLDRLTSKQRESLPIEEQIALAKHEYDQATQAFIDSHKAAGGETPAYVARTKIPSGIQHPSRLAGMNRFTAKMAREHTSSGHSVTSGEFIYDPRSVLHENAQVQRLRQHVGAFEDIGNLPSTEHVVGSADRENPTLVPKGMVAVNPENYRSAAHTAPLWEDQPVAMHDLQRENTIRHHIAQSWEQGARTAGERIPAGEKVVLIPEAAHKRIVEWAKPTSKDGLMALYDKLNANYQRILIGIYPSTWMGNAPGSIPLAVASGALHPAHYAMARRIGKAPEDRIPVPQSIQGLGVGGSQLPGGNAGIVMRGVGKGREASMLGEDLSARAAWFGQMRPIVEGYLPVARKLFPVVEKAMPEKWKGLAHQTNRSVDELYHAMASGHWGDGTRISPEFEAIRNRAIDHVEEFMGVSGKPMSGASRNVGRVIIFHRWLGHILKLTLVSLPLSHPRRATLINAMAVYGDEYRKKHGVYPSWMSQFLPLMSQSQAGAPGMLSLGLGQLTPLASATNLASAGSQAFTGDPLKLAASLVAPLLQPAASAGLQLERNQMNRAGEKDYSVRNALLAGIERAVPGSSKFQSGIGGGAGYEPGSNNLTGMRKKQYYIYSLSPSGKGYTRTPIPWDQRPGARPTQGLLGVGSRFFGLPLEWSATGGKPLLGQQRTTNTFAKLDADAARKAAGRSAAKKKAKRG